MEITYLNEEGERISKNCDLEFGKEPHASNGEMDLLSADETLLEKGYHIFSLRKMDTLLDLERIITAQIVQRLSIYQQVPKDFELSNYHNCLTRLDNHFRVSTWALDYEVLGSAFFDIKHQMEDLLKFKLAVKKIKHNGVDGEYVGFRILRPLKNDHNPFHRDAWIPYWRDTVNIWLPLCGFENANTLQMIPGSHNWADSQILKTKAGVEIDGKTYHVPAAIGTVNDFTIDTPDLIKGEGLVFSPFLIHGNGVNRKPNTTRVSLEFRFCRQ
ncbi:MAG: phytanoyl-CoA dioxygenase family protein [Chitinophagales bacterium]|nr:phytanoyl-CoA dioxygenase family protein [Chitinophagales bacterium]